jgi:hypothetical protein
VLVLIYPIGFEVLHHACGPAGLRGILGSLDKLATSVA